MKAIRTLKALACAIPCLALAPTAMAEFRTEARKVFAEHQDSIYGVRALLKMTITMNGQQAGAQEQALWTNAAVIDEGLLVTSYRSLKPDVSASAPNRPGLQIETELSELKLIDASGEEYDAKLVLHDEVLGLAFVAIDPKSENSVNFKAKPLDYSHDSKLELLQQLIAIGRMGENMRYEGQLKTGEVTAIVEHPRTLAQVTGMSSSSTVFNESGQVVGMIVVQEAKRGQQPLPMLLPSKYIRDLVKQAKEKQAALSEG